MASKGVKDFYEEVFDKGFDFLVEKTGVTAKAAVNALYEMRKVAFGRALDLAMELESYTAVQPDWLIVITTCFMWWQVCK